MTTPLHIQPRRLGATVCPTVIARDLFRRLHLPPCSEDWLWDALREAGLAAGIDFEAAEAAEAAEDTVISIYATMAIVTRPDCGFVGIQVFRELVAHQLAGFTPKVAS